MPPTIDQIETVARLEREFLETRTRVERVADAIGSFAGSIQFVILHLVWFALWVAINTGRFGIPAFDPFPYVFLSMIVSLEAVLLSTFVLMKQNRMSQRADHRDHLNLQVDMLTEREVTKILQMLQRICERMGLEQTAKDSEVEQLSQATAIDALAQELRDKLPSP
jgi:uncharacterized membrane protein